MLDLVKIAVEKGAKLHVSVSGGKDSQAMTKVVASMFAITSLIHADLGSVEWEQSLPMCERLAAEFNVPLHIVKRTDGRGMMDHWRARMETLRGSGNPFWSSSKARYCTSDMKRDPINKLFRSFDEDFIISCEGLRAQESEERKKKDPFTIRRKITSTYYDGMTPEEAIAAYKPGKRLALTWFPIFNFTKEDVWNTYGMSADLMTEARADYQATEEVPTWWPFHPAYVFGNERVSCVFCVLGCAGDLAVGAKHRPELLEQMIALELEGQATFKDGYSLTKLLNK